MGRRPLVQAFPHFSRQQKTFCKHSALLFSHAAMSPSILPGAQGKPGEHSLGAGMLQSHGSKPGTFNFAPVAMLPTVKNCDRKVLLEFCSHSQRRPLQALPALRYAPLHEGCSFRRAGAGYRGILAAIRIKFALLGCSFLSFRWVGWISQCSCLP